MVLLLKSIAMTEDDSAGGFPSKINVVVNWFEELKDRVQIDLKKTYSIEK